MGRQLKAVVFGIIIAVLTQFYRLILHDLLFVSLGIGRVIQPIENFPYTCQRLYHPLLETCEDLWLDDEDRTLYAACVDIDSRENWSPASVTCYAFNSFHLKCSHEI
jgi:hypothetical protein